MPKYASEYRCPLPFLLPTFRSTLLLEASGVVNAVMEVFHRVGRGAALVVFSLAERSRFRRMLAARGAAVISSRFTWIIESVTSGRPLVVVYLNQCGCKANNQVSSYPLYVDSFSYAEGSATQAATLTLPPAAATNAAAQRLCNNPNMPSGPTTIGCLTTLATTGMKINGAEQMP
jgi:hypothetical protein